MELVLAIFIPYLLGAIPFGLILTKIFLKKDVRKIGSGNIGATNVLRTGNKIVGYSTLILDILKSVVPIIYIKINYPDLIYISSLSVFLGHVFPIWLKFKGGKGVATYLGILFSLSIELSLLFIFTWIVVSLIFKYSSLSSMFSSLTVLVVTIIKDTALRSFDIESKFDQDLTFVLFIFFILIIFTHRKNILNLKNKNEGKIKI
mgnify:CR=1 FL=1